jgi:excisionase family DNA binding protein
MGTTLDHEYLTVAEAAALLKVDRSTIRRWIDHGDLPAYRVGPRAVRVRREDLDQRIAPARPHPPASGSLNTADESAIPERMTAEEQRRGFAALAAIERLQADLWPRLRASPVAPAWELLNEARDERDRQLDSRSR